MRIVILTSNRRGTASYCLPVLQQRPGVEIAQVIYCEGVTGNKSKLYRRKIRKIIRIGLLGALNGIRMRKWFSIRSVDGAPIEDIGKLCADYSIPFAVSSGINTRETMDLLSASRPDLGLSLGNSYISSKVFSIPRRGMINIHGEILPRFQNAQSVIWQLYEGSGQTGYTIHEVEKKIDAGRIIKQESFPILFRESLAETVAETCREILRRAALGLADVVTDFEKYERDAVAQGAGSSYTTPSIRQFYRIVRNFKRLKQAGAGKH